MNSFSRYAPLIVGSLAVLTIAGAMMPPGHHDDRMDVYEFGTIPVVDRGRTKPFDTFARTTLFALSDKSDFTDENDHTQSAVTWALDVMSERLGPDGKTPVWVDYKVFRITNDQVLKMLGLIERPGFRYSFRELQNGDPELPRSDSEPNIKKLFRDAEKADERKPGERDLYDVKVMEVAQNVALLRKMMFQETPLMVPGKNGEEWVAFAKAMLEDGTPDPNYPAAKYLNVLFSSYKAGKTEDFNKIVPAYKEFLVDVVPGSIDRRNGFEVFFNHFEPFSLCAVLYAFAFILACSSWIGWREPLRLSAFWLMIVVLVVHSFAIISRMYLLDRPMVFVTNLYSSAIFIGWGGVVLCLSVEFFFPLGIAAAVGATVGALTLIVAHNIAVGDTLEMMQAVLDTNFWLATHVSCVTMGYMATFVAGFLGIAYVIAGVFTRALDRNMVKLMGQMVYGVVCFAMMFSFIGTVLGGIWADQSWGRFWGWDPKENGALLIVIWNALILHARWGGMVQQRGMAVLTIAGNIVTTWSWFGTNMLGVGLHAYGFMQGAVFWLLFFITTQLVLIGIGSMPLRMWTSFALPLKPLETMPPPSSASKKGKKGKGGSTAIQPA